ncbi:helix-turn-helix transcriptional regulator [Streptomyces sp. TRM68367]|nr:helix-turn-helix transcriptional regulator [Streptomyces sp. TRM68367]
MNHAPEAVKYAREAAGLTLKELAERVGVSEPLMSAIERGQRNATPKNLNKMAEALNCPRVVLEAKRVQTPYPAPVAEPRERQTA